MRRARRDAENPPSAVVPPIQGRLLESRTTGRVAPQSRRSSSSARDVGSMRSCVSWRNTSNFPAMTKGACASGLPSAAKIRDAPGDADGLLFQQQPRLELAIPAGSSDGVWAGRVVDGARQTAHLLQHGLIEGDRVGRWSQMRVAFLPQMGQRVVARDHAAQAVADDDPVVAPSLLVVQATEQRDGREPGTRAARGDVGRRRAQVSGGVAGVVQTKRAGQIPRGREEQHSGNAVLCEGRHRRHAVRERPTARPVVRPSRRPTSPESVRPRPSDCASAACGTTR